MKPRDCVLKSEFRTLGWEICRRTGLTFNDVYIYWHGNVGEHVVMIQDKFAGYAEEFWLQGHIERYVRGNNGKM